MADVVRTIVKGRAYLRKRDLAKVVDIDEFRQAYVIRYYSEMDCLQCPRKSVRFSKEYCAPCLSYHGKNSLTDEVNIEGKLYISVPLGAMRSIERTLEVELKIIKDLRKYPKMAKRYKVVIDLYDGTPAPDGTMRVDQRGAIDAWKAAGCVGVINASPRSGKTALAVAASVELQAKTLIITGSSDLNQQFWDTYCGDGSRRIRATNIPPKRVVMVDKMSDFDMPHDVAIITYQKFIRETADERIMEYINNNFQLVIVDECHNLGAQAYGEFLHKLDIPYRLGLSATPRRKDGKFKLSAAILGDTVVKTAKVGLKPTIHIRETNRLAGRNYRAWHKLSDLFESDEVRNQQIVDMAFEMLDVRNHAAVLIPVDRSNHIDALVEALNDKQLQRHRKDRNEPDIIAMSLDGRTPKGAAREKKFAEFDDPNSPFKILVAQRKMVKEGIDLKRPSCVICPIPMSASITEGAPLFEQLSYRASTYQEGKRKPEVFILADASLVLEKMIQGLLRFEVLRNDIARIGDRRGIYYVDDSCHKFLGGTGTTSIEDAGKLGGVRIRR